MACPTAITSGSYSRLICLFILGGGHCPDISLSLVVLVGLTIVASVVVPVVIVSVAGVVV
ncbi:hypothetical protein Tco_0834558, partial [Tanacetum coccineum]